MKYSCCIEMLFTEYEFVERIHKASAAGFDCVEFWCWENKDIPAVKKALAETGMEVGVFQGNLEGRMVDPADKDKYVAGVKKSVEVAKELGADTLFLMSDIMQEDRSVLEAPYPLSAEEKRAATKAVLEALIPTAEAAGITFVIEPLNTTVDHKGYSLCHSAPAFELVREIGNPHIRALYDAYHMQIMEGNIIETVRAGVDAIGYFHVADVPGRFEPGTGELNYANIIAALKAAGYDGKVGFEFEPKNGRSMETVKKVFEITGK
jgi:hydroxypyruvate isomerase